MRCRSGTFGDAGGRDSAVAAAEAVKRVETNSEGAEIVTQVLVQPAVEQRVDAGRRHREALEREIGEFEVPAADQPTIQFGDQSEHVPRQPADDEVDDDRRQNSIRLVRARHDVVGSGEGQRRSPSTALRRRRLARRTSRKRIHCGTGTVSGPGGQGLTTTQPQTGIDPTVERGMPVYVPRRGFS